MLRFRPAEGAQYSGGVDTGYVPPASIEIESMEAKYVATKSANVRSGPDGSAGLVGKLDRAGFAVASGSACSSANPEPSHTLMAMGVEAGLARASARRGNETRYESLPRDFHERVRKGFLDIAAAEPDRCLVIDATAGVEAVASAIVEAVTLRLKV